MRKTILVVEARPSIQDLIAPKCEDSGYKVLRVSTAKEAFEAIRASLPDLILLDWTLPDMPGAEVTRRVRANQRGRHLPIILLSPRSSELDKIAGLDSGADDYVTTPFSPRELFARINAILRERAPQTADQSIRVGILKLDPATRRIDANGSSLTLAPTEYRLLHFLLKRAGRVLTRAQILASVWGDDARAEERTVDVSIRRLRMQLAPIDHQIEIETVRGEGYRLSASNPAEKEVPARRQCEHVLP
jgi:two-component system phosphate regulon response regulator PhoB